MGAGRRVGTDRRLRGDRGHRPDRIHSCPRRESRAIDGLCNEQLRHPVAGRERRAGRATAVHDRPAGDRSDQPRQRGPMSGRRPTTRPQRHVPTPAQPHAGPDDRPARRVIGWLVSDREQPRALLAVLGTTGVVITTEPSALAAATVAALDEIDAIDRACSRFRSDSDLTARTVRAGQPVEVSPTMLDAVEVARTRRRAHRRGRRPDGGPSVAGPRLRPRLRSGRPRRAAPVLTVTAVAALARGRRRPRRARRSAFRTESSSISARRPRRSLPTAPPSGRTVAAGCGVLVSLGGDIAVAGDGSERRLAGAPRRPPRHRPHRARARGLRSRRRPRDVEHVGTAVASRRRRGAPPHRSRAPGGPAVEVWRTVSVAAGSLRRRQHRQHRGDHLGHADAVEWLDGLGLPARLVATDGTETFVGAADSRGRLRWRRDDRHPGRRRWQVDVVPDAGKRDRRAR